MTEDTEQLEAEAPPPLSLEEIYEEEASKEAESDQEASEENDGPSYEGELDSSDEADVDLEEEEEDEEFSDEDLDRELYGDEEEEDEEEVVQEDDEPVAPEDSQEPEQNEVTQLRELLAQQQQMNARLVEHLKQQQPETKPDGQAKSKEPQRTLEDSQFEEAFRLILYGTSQDKEEFDSLPSPVRKKAAQAAQQHSKNESLNALYPFRRYKSQMQYYVQQEISDAVKELRKDYHDRRAKDAFTPYEGVITTPDDRRRLGELMLRMPGADSTDWKVQKRVLDLAVKEVLREKEYADLAERADNLEARERQLNASKRTRRKGKGRRTHSRGNRPPKLKPGMDLVDYANSLLESE